MLICRLWRDSRTLCAHSFDFAVAGKHSLITPSALKVIIDRVEMLTRPPMSALK